MRIATRFCIVLNTHDDGSEVSTARGSGWVNLLIDGQSNEVGADTGIYIRPGETFCDQRIPGRMSSR